MPADSSIALARGSCHSLKMASATCAAPAIKCTTCGVLLLSHEELRAHHRSQWHHYNLKRRLAGMVPTSEDTFHQKKAALAAVSVVQVSRGQDHIKRKDGPTPTQMLKERSTERPSSERLSPPVEADDSNTRRLPSQNISAVKTALASGYGSSSQCLFDANIAESLNENIKYMESKFSFSLNDQDYIVDLDGLIRHLGQKVYEFNQCLFCNQCFRSLGAVWRHMISKGHTAVGINLPEQQEELEPFYDFTKSYKEIEQLLLERRKKTERVLRRRYRAVKRLPAASAPTVAASREAKSDAEDEGPWEDAAGDELDGVAVASSGKSFVSHRRNRTTKRTQLQRARPASDFQKRESQEVTVEHVHMDRMDATSQDEEDPSQCIAVAEDILLRMGLRRAYVNDLGNLVLPDGCQAAHRDIAVIYKKRPITPYNAILPYSTAEPRWSRPLAKASKNAAGPYITVRSQAGIGLLTGQLQVLGNPKGRFQFERNFEKFKLRTGIRSNKLQRKILRAEKYFI